MGENLKRSETNGADHVMQLNFSKKRKLCCELQNEYRGYVELSDNAVSPAASRTSGCCECDESGEDGRSFRSLDLEDVDGWQSAEGLGMEISKSNGIFSREATPTSELCGDSQQIMLMDDSPSPSTRKPVLPPPVSPRKIISASATNCSPSTAELDEFFVAAEKYVQERFSEKYNYDIVKDVPLEGRYQWVRLHR